MAYNGQGYDSGRGGRGGSRGGANNQGYNPYGQQGNYQDPNQMNNQFANMNVNAQAFNPNVQAFKGGVGQNPTFEKKTAPVVHGLKNRVS